MAARKACSAVQSPEGVQARSRQAAVGSPKAGRHRNVLHSVSGGYSTCSPEQNLQQARAHCQGHPADEVLMAEGVHRNHSQSHRWWCQSKTIGTPHCWLKGSRSRTEKAEGQSSFSTVSRFLQCSESKLSTDIRLPETRAQSAPASLQDAVQASLPC